MIPARFAAAALLGLVLMFVGEASGQRVRIVRQPEPATVRSDYRDLRSDESAIHDLVNSERARRGLGTLDWDDALADVARRYSQQMAREGFFDHFDPDGRSVVDRVSSARIRGWSMIGENLFFCKGYSDFDGVAVRGWLASPEHRKNMLDGRYDAAGIGVARSRDGRVYITQVFLAR